MIMRATFVAHALSLIASFVISPIAANGHPANSPVEAGVGIQNESLPLGQPYPYPSGPTSWTDEFKGKQWDYEIHAYRYPTAPPISAEDLLANAVKSLETEVSDIFLSSTCIAMSAHT